MVWWCDADWLTAEDVRAAATNENGADSDAAVQADNGDEDEDDEDEDDEDDGEDTTRWLQW